MDHWTGERRDPKGSIHDSCAESREAARVDGSVQVSAVKVAYLYHLAVYLGRLAHRLDFIPSLVDSGGGVGAADGKLPGKRWRPVERTETDGLCES